MRDGELWRPEIRCNCGGCRKGAAAMHAMWTASARFLPRGGEDEDGAALGHVGWGWEARGPHVCMTASTTATVAILPETRTSEEGERVT